MMNIEQLMAQHKNQAAAFYHLANQAVEGVERLAELNLKTLRAALEDSQARTEALFGVKDIAGLVALGQKEVKAAVDKTSAYGRELQDIFSGMGDQYVKFTHSHTADAHKQFNALVENAVKNAPKGAEQAAAAIQAAVSNANAAFESVQTSVKQVTDQTVTNFEKVAQNALKSAEAVIKGKKAA